MKLKNVLITAFLLLTVLPIILMFFLLYQSSLRLSSESYLRNLKESIHVQVDYITQTIENNMVSDSRFAAKVLRLGADGASAAERKNAVLPDFQTYLETSEDKLAVCVLMDEENRVLYSVGEKSTLDAVSAQASELYELTQQEVTEFDLGGGAYSLGIVTPVWENGTYRGTLISIYDENYIFKIVSSYYELADTATYICRENGGIVNFRGTLTPDRQAAYEEGLGERPFQQEGRLELQTPNRSETCYYKNISPSSWYLVGMIDHTQVYGFTNQFIWVYMAIIAAILLVAIVLSLLFSRRAVRPIHWLIQLMDGYPDSLRTETAEEETGGYFETRYLRTAFLSLMRKIQLVQHNFEGVYQLYQSSAMDDTNIDIDVKGQTVHSNKETFNKLMNSLVLPESACVVERFIGCFCEKDQHLLTDLFETMRDEHLSVTREAEIFTPHFNQKWFHILVVPMYEDERLSRLFVQLRDISSFKKQELESMERAQREPLTGLYNRFGFESRAKRLLQENVDKTHALLFLDVNDFKLVNDTFGHSAGDDLLRSIGNALRDVLSPADIASRFGGDEFAVFLACVTEERLASVQQTLAAQLVYPFTADSLSFTVTASIGCSVCTPALPVSLEELLHRADSRMYAVKRKYKQQHGGNGATPPSSAPSQE